jgi:hypothetical protein
MSAPVRFALPDWPRLMPVDLAAKYVGIGSTMLRESGPQPKRLGKRVLYDRQDLDRWVDGLDGQPLNPREREEESDDVLKRVQERLSGSR